MVDDESYPLDFAHRDLAIVSDEIGYEVVDLLAVFREQLRDGRRFRVDPNDNHFNSDVHSIVADVIY